MYEALAPYYDRLMTGVDYSAWADFIVGEFSLAGGPVRRVFDIGCGTGAMAIELSKRGYELTGADISPEMLALADCRTRDAGLEVIYVTQDMRGLRLGNRADAVTCCLDGINYLTGKASMDRCFASVNLCLNEGGVFIFDVNTPYKFANVYARRDYILEAEGVLCAWRNDYDSESGLCDFDLSLFIERADGGYTRHDELQTERCYSEKEIKSALLRHGFVLRGFYGGYDRRPASDVDERWYFTAVKG